MNKVLLKSVLWVARAMGGFIALGCIIFSLDVSAREISVPQSDNRDGFTGKVSLTLTAEKEAYAEGEDIRLEVAVMNLCDTALKIPMPYLTGNIVFHIVDAKGKVVPFDFSDRVSNDWLRLESGRGWKEVLGLMLYSNDSLGRLAGALTRILAGEYTFRASMKDVTSNEVCIKINKQSQSQRMELAEIHQVFDVNSDDSIEKGMELISKESNSVYLPTIYSRLINKMRRANSELNLNDVLLQYCEEFIEKFPDSFVPISKLEHYMFGVERAKAIVEGRVISSFQWNDFERRIEAIQEKFKGKRIVEYIDEYMMRNGMIRREATGISTMYPHRLWSDGRGVVASAGGSTKNYYLEPDKGVVVGYVMEARTKEPLLGVNVHVKGTAFSVKTDADGYYCFELDLFGGYSLEVETAGHGMQTKPVVFLPGESDVANFHLLTESEIWEKEAKRDIREGTIRIIQHGIVVTSIISPEEDRKITERYGFVYGGGGCVIPSGESVYNAIVNEYLDKRNGKGWRKRMDAEFEKRKRELEME